MNFSNVNVKFTVLEEHPVIMLICSNNSFLRVNKCAVITCWMVKSVVVRFFSWVLDRDTYRNWWVVRTVFNSVRFEINYNWLWHFHDVFSNTGAVLFFDDSFIFVPVRDFDNRDLIC